MLCEPAAFQTQVMLSPAAIVSTAGFVVPLRALRKKMLPAETSPTGWPPPPGEVTPPHPASSVAVTSNGMRRMLQAPCRIIRSWRQGLRLAVDEVVHHDEVLVPPALTSAIVASNAASPLVISTRATIGESNTAPTKVNPWAPRWAGDAMLASSTPFASKYSTRVAAALSTSENTT